MAYEASCVDGMNQISIEIGLAFTVGVAIVTAFWSIFMLWISGRLKSIDDNIKEVKDNHKDLEKRFYDYIMDDE